MIAQDSPFMSTDVAGLERFGVRAVGASDAVRRVGTDALLFMPPQEDVNVLIPQVLQGATPTIYVGTDVISILKVLSAPGYSASYDAFPCLQCAFNGQ